MKKWGCPKCGGGEARHDPRHEGNALTLCIIVGRSNWLNLVDCLFLMDIMLLMKRSLGISIDTTDAEGARIGGFIVCTTEGEFIDFVDEDILSDEYAQSGKIYTDKYPALSLTTPIKVTKDVYAQMRKYHKRVR
jgi:hypothetical protein